MACAAKFLLRQLRPSTINFTTRIFSSCCTYNNSIPSPWHSIRPPITSAYTKVHGYDLSTWKVGPPQHQQTSVTANLTEKKKWSKSSVDILAQKYRPLRSFQNDDNPKKPLRRVPKLILVQNPFSWLMRKIDFGVLKIVWDSKFNENDFKFGTRQAISRVTQVISDGQYADLNGLLTKPAKDSLMRELDRNWSTPQRGLLALSRDDIQVTSTRKVHFIRIAGKKYCDVDMAFLALKWVPIQSIDALIFTEIFARFHREYTQQAIPEWTIAYFKVVRFQILKKKDQLL